MYLAISSTTEGQVLQTDLACLEQWEKIRDMQFNPSKCQVLHITKNVKPLNTKYILHNVELESASAAKYLGVTIADDLLWSPHIDITTKKANQTLGFLKRNIRVHNKDLKLFAYKTLVRQACHNFFVKKPKSFENVKSEHGLQFSEKPDSARVNHNFQKFSDLGHKNHACWINHYNEHDTTSFLSAYNESEVN